MCNEGPTTYRQSERVPEGFVVCGGAAIADFLHQIFTLIPVAFHLSSVSGGEKKKKETLKRRGMTGDGAVGSDLLRGNFVASVLCAFSVITDF